MIFGIGSDIISHTRIAATYTRHGDRFARRILSQQEWAEYCAHPFPVRLLMKRFAAKEALAKAVGSGLRSPVTLQRISVMHDALGKPGFVFDQDLANHICELGVTHHHLSISDDHDVAIAFVVLERA